MFALVLVACGCGKSNPEGRMDVSGTIKLNGQLLTTPGTIKFEPIGGDPQDGGSGRVVDSKFLLTGMDGIKPGKYKVKIGVEQLYDRKTGEPSTAQTGDFDSYRVHFVPPEFNANSTIEFEVVQGKRNVFDYDIVTDYKPDTTPPKGRTPVLN